ncbi:hypothetical protein ABFV83_10295 [Lacrimispora sp. BS-2]|uniref:Uncharacterized protein n=1 Tax=Lacrimispora sp. BS-2 TaxID=3151850 RepID=A0AAU7PVB8_9FIRM
MSVSEERSSLEKVQSETPINRAEIINMPRFKADGTTDLRYGSK